MCARRLRGRLDGPGGRGQGRISLVFLRYGTSPLTSSPSDPPPLTLWTRTSVPGTHAETFPTPNLRSCEPVSPSPNPQSTRTQTLDQDDKGLTFWSSVSGTEDPDELPELLHRHFTNRDPTVHGGESFVVKENDITENRTESVIDPLDPNQGGRVYSRRG